MIMSNMYLYAYFHYQQSSEDIEFVPNLLREAKNLPCLIAGVGSHNHKLFHHCSEVYSTKENK